MNAKFLLPIRFNIFGIGKFSNLVRIVFFLFLVSFLLPTCKKKVHKVDHNFIGKWQSFDQCNLELIIREASEGSYHRYDCDVDLMVHFDNAVKIRNGKLFLKESSGLQRRTILEILEWPTAVDTTIIFPVDIIKSRWRMKLKDPSHFGGDVLTFYKTKEKEL